MKKIRKKAGSSITQLLACFVFARIPRVPHCLHQPRVPCVGWLVAQRIFAPYIRPTKNPPVRPYFNEQPFHKNEMLRSRSAETPKASRNRYWPRWLVRIRIRSGPGNPPIFTDPTGRRTRRPEQARAKWRKRGFRLTEKSISVKEPPNHPIFLRW